MRIFLVSKILSLEEKREIFKLEFVRIIDEFYSDNLGLYNYLQEKLLEQIRLELENDYKTLRELEKNMVPLTAKHKEATKQLSIIAENLNKINTELQNREELYDSTILMLKEDLGIENYKSKIK